MNNLIKELEKQCWSHRVEGALVDGQLHFDSQKFAELIVAECARELDERTVFVRGHRAGTWIKRHFGVEE